VEQKHYNIVVKQACRENCFFEKKTKIDKFSISPLVAAKELYMKFDKESVKSPPYKRILQIHTRR